MTTAIGSTVLHCLTLALIILCHLLRGETDTSMPSHVGGDQTTVVYRQSGIHQCSMNEITSMTCLKLYPVGEAIYVMELATPLNVVATHMARLCLHHCQSEGMDTVMVTV